MFDYAAAEADVVVVEDDGLARCDGALRFVEAYLEAVVAHADDTGLVALAIAGARRAAEMPRGGGAERSLNRTRPRAKMVQGARQGKVRRARLYYLRGLTGKAARIKEDVAAAAAIKAANKAANKAASAE